MGPRNHPAGKASGALRGASQSFYTDHQNRGPGAAGGEAAAAAELVGPSTMYRAGSPKYLSTPTLRKIISISFVVARPNYANAKRSLGMDLGSQSINLAG